jgi:hypothetical protein
MKTAQPGSFNDLVEQRLGARLPAELADRISFPDLPEDARTFVHRMLFLMKRASVPATEITPHMIWLLSAVNPAMLPSAWGGRIPPLTSPGRHGKLDAYVESRAAAPAEGRPVFIDLGCGFPPLTTVDTAAAFPGWSVFGVDPAFSRYVLYDAEGAYACFDRDGKFQYLQSPKKPLNDTPDAARIRFQKHFEKLFPGLNRFDAKISETVEKDGHRLVCNHIRDFEAENLSFVKSEVESLHLPPAQVVRCMNLLLYFEKPVREKMLASIAGLLGKGGLLITGFNHPAGIYRRYAVFEKNQAGLRPCEFAFSPDNLRPLGTGPWVTLENHDREAGLLADLTCALRADGNFWEEFDRRVDALQTQLGICRRGKGGFFRFADDAQTALPPSVMKSAAALWQRAEAEGFTDGAVQALCRAGYRAWKNPVGDIAVEPPEGSLPAEG